MTSHLLLLLLFAFFVALVFAVIAHDEPRAQAALGARIFAICDTYDAIISDRPYRKGQSPDAALAEILRCAGTQFDPKVVEAFEAAFPRWRDEDHGDSRKPLYLPAWRDDSDAPGRAAG